MCRELGLKIRFVPQCLVPTPTSLGFAGLWNFGHRQYLITRVYTPGLYAAALAFTTLYVAGFLSAWGWLLAWLVTDAGARYDWTVAGAVSAIAVVAWANGRRAQARRRVVSRAFQPVVQAQLRPALRWDRWGTPVWMAMHWLLMVRAVLGRTMVWRGIRYRLRGPRRIARLAEPAAGA